MFHLRISPMELHAGAVMHAADVGEGIESIWELVDFEPTHPSEVLVRISSAFSTDMVDNNPAAPDSAEAAKDSTALLGS